ncbi:MAG TPA: hypothetical protein DD827_06660 [Gammaproteobacteria bacterium]|jgi:hypothetical protein|nr:hypothetical protein [Gammaproteobacteria bacterium]
MYSASSIGGFKTVLNDFKLDGMMIRYSNFIPRFYNYCLSLGMEPGKIMPSRAFCSDESQGLPIILITKEFGTFPFNHGKVGGVVATDRHGPHAEHGQDIVIIQASHVGYDAELNQFGTYRRVQTADCHHEANCGKLKGVVSEYQGEYNFACQNIFLEPSKNGAEKQISINNLLLNERRKEGLFLDAEKLIAYYNSGSAKLLRSLSTARTFEAATELINLLGDDWPEDKRRPIDAFLKPELFSFKRNFSRDEQELRSLEINLIDAMPWIVTHAAPSLAAAQINTQVEFDRTYRTIILEEGYQNRRLVFISGLNIDISPQKDDIFPLTKFIPWAAYVQDNSGQHCILEQQEIFDILMSFDAQSENKIDLEAAIAKMEKASEVSVSFEF